MLGEAVENSLMTDLGFQRAHRKGLQMVGGVARASGRFGSKQNLRECRPVGVWGMGNEPES